jgi:hypothetical protein
MILWHVNDTGHVEVRLRAEGDQIATAKDEGNRLVANIITDLSNTLSIDVLSDELRYSFSKTRPEVTIIWRTRVPDDRIDDVRTYLGGLAEGMQ